jgi:hypothetical protein
MKLSILGLAIIVQMNAYSQNFRDLLVKDKKFIRIESEVTKCSLFYPNEVVYSHLIDQTNIALLNCHDIKDRLINIITHDHNYFNRMILADLNLLFNAEEKTLTENTNAKVIATLEDGRYQGKGVTVIKKHQKLKSKKSLEQFTSSYVQQKVGQEISNIQHFWNDFNEIYSSLDLIQIGSNDQQYCGLYQNEILLKTYDFFNDSHPIGPFQSYTFGFTSMLEFLGAPLICKGIETESLKNNIKNKIFQMVVRDLKNNKITNGNNSSTKIYCQELNKLKLAKDDSYFGPLVKSELEKQSNRLTSLEQNQAMSINYAHELCW